ncbi:hypothetical protein HGG64_02555 [Mycoplasma phocoeninasale]|uniref:Uncharacterized protein n=1 Tax=Mycoplasma phocoeninasale TaxID=2726117 RepID=A0A858U272_9MOLU|nr:hypothetical protein [Mycoplasma phocoeninasale]QJG66570.1 hypothetical protein HGG64_02555 [Mycoplasma phocoeninasale]
MTIKIDYEQKSDESKFITISNLSTTKTDRNLKINLDKKVDSDWNRDKINDFLFTLVAEDGRSEMTIQITDRAEKNRQDVKEINFIIQLFEAFVKFYNEGIK